MTQLDTPRAHPRLPFALAVLAAACASLAWTPFAAAQSGTPGIGRLPTTLYLPGAAPDAPPAPVPGGPAMAASGGAARQVKDLAALLKDQPKPFAAATTPALTAASAQSFIQHNAKELGVDGKAGVFQLSEARQTLSGRYLSLEQRLNGLRIIDGHIQITLGDDGAVQSVTRHIVSVPLAKAAGVMRGALLDEKAAREIAWQDLAVTGELLEPPQVEKAYLNENNVLTLVYVVRLAVSRPMGYWEHRIDAVTGRIISRTDRRVQERKRAPDVVQELQQLREPRGEGQRALAAGPLPSSAAALQNLAQRQQAAASLELAQKTAVLGAAPALVFNSNPMTALADATLQNTDAASRFDAAYAKVTLEQLRRSNGLFRLNGALVRIDDFEPGENGAKRPPSTAAVEWSARRGDNAFNDVMSYHHIHNSLAYLKKLGYDGTRALFRKAIAVDTDGVNGDDNSHYVPGSDRLAFGHGCVDDNEDSDVILHELGHAIHYHVNPQWGGGDSGAVGEGFGDYWAVSNRMRMKDGWAFQPGKVFVWDGIDACWGGRRVDRKDARYDPARTYGAHEQVGAFVADELWSTPLIGALLEIVAGGADIGTVDTVVLEGMAGIGSDFTMRSLALKTIAQARQLYPDQPHAAIFEKHFKLHGIVK